MERIEMLKNGCTLVRGVLSMLPDREECLDRAVDTIEAWVDGDDEVTYYTLFNATLQAADVANEAEAESLVECVAEATFFLTVSSYVSEAHMRDTYDLMAAAVALAAARVSNVQVADCTWQDLCEWEAGTNPRRQAPVVLILDPALRTAHLSTWADMYGAPMCVYHGERHHYAVGSVDADGLIAYLRDGDGAELLRRVCDGWTSEWDGSNWIGKTSEDAQVAQGELEEILRDWSDDGYGGMWEAADWVQTADAEDIGLRIGMTGADLDVIARALCSDALSDNCVIDHDDMVEQLTVMVQDMMIGEEDEN